MKKLSVFQITLLAAFGALAVAGVLIFAFAIGGGTTTQIGAVTIWGTLDSNAFAAVLRQAAEANSSLSQVSYDQKDPATFDSDLTKALAGGTGPDLILLPQDSVYKDAAELVVIPDTLVSQSQFSSTFIDAADPFYGTSGALAFPLLVDPLVLFWNKDLLASAGFSSPPEYWDQLFAIAEKVSVKDSSGTISKSAIDFGEYQNVDHAKDILATLILQVGGTVTGFDSAGHLISALVPKTGGAAAAAESALTFYTEFADPSKDFYSWNRALPDGQQAFSAGQLALYVGYASERDDISRGNPNLNFGVAALPQIRSAPNTSDTALVYALAASRGGKNPSAAITVAAALATAANSQALSTALGIPSARRDVLSAAAQKPPTEALISQNDICQGVDPIVCSAQIAHSWIDPDPDATDSIFQTMIEDTTSGAALPSAALQRADQAMTQLLSPSSQ